MRLTERFALLKPEVTRSLKSYSLNEYEKLAAESVVLEQDKHGVKVLQTPEGRIVKFFRQKRLFSSALFKSYASRFVDNARSLNRLGVITVEVEDVLYCKAIKRALVFYKPIPGQTLRDVLQGIAKLPTSCLQVVRYGYFYDTHWLWCRFPSPLTRIDLS